MFPIQFYNKNKVAQFNDEIEICQKFSKVTRLPYIDKIMWWIPSFFTKSLVRLVNKTVRHIDFSQYDIVVLESGKPLFLIDKIKLNTKLIYRQSDSVKHILSRNKYLWELEEKCIERADLVLTVKPIFNELINSEYKSKVVTVVNGFDAVNVDKKIKDNIIDNIYSKSVVYLGLAPIDYETIKLLCEENKEVKINIIGNCLSKREVRKLSKYNNFYYYGNLIPKEYMKIITQSNVAIIPYAKVDAIKYWGLTSKYLLFMKLGMPIVSYEVGLMDEFKDIKIYFAKNKEQFSTLVKRALENNNINYDIDYSYYSKEGRIKEFIEVMKKSKVL